MLSFAKRSVTLRKLCVVEVPAATKCFVELDHGKPPITRGLGKSEFSGIEKLLSLKNLVVAGEPPQIAPVGDCDRFSQSGNLALLLFLESA